jgi:hypothetical protein
VSTVKKSQARTLCAHRLNLAAPRTQVMFQKNRARGPTRESLQSRPTRLGRPSPWVTVGAAGAPGSTRCRAAPALIGTSRDDLP